MRTALAGAAALAVTALPLAAFATPAAAADDAKVVVFHGVPGLTVDVYVSADGTYTAEEALLTDFEPGTVTDPVDLPAGTSNLAVFAADGDPSGEYGRVSGSPVYGSNRGCGAATGSPVYGSNRGWGAVAPSL